ncbi:unnamed protein product [Arabis nemorensis]|uniref:Uncharacterized protein n=1 Tax=Arabis nemorensis TaxID=586526 RepID=A0A565BSE6_9BRAS|nr:unnamed protein product [Arabis nemorensis]
MSNSKSLLLFCSLLFSLTLSVYSDLQVKKPPPPPLQPVTPVVTPPSPQPVKQPSPSNKPPSPPTTPPPPPVMPKDAARTGDQRCVLEHAPHVVLGASVYRPARMETGRNAANVTQT